jgi:hypothetical protein
MDEDISKALEHATRINGVSSSSEDEDNDILIADYQKRLAELERRNQELEKKVTMSKVVIDAQSKAITKLEAKLEDRLKKGKLI